MAACPEEYNETRERLVGAATRLGIQMFIPPPLTDEFYDPESGRYVWKHVEQAPIQGAGGIAAHPYPEGVHCICPWMTLTIDCWGNLYPCAHRLGVPYGNILAQEREEAINTLDVLKRRRGILRGKHMEVCPNCKPSSPHSDPMKRRISRILFRT